MFIRLSLFTYSFICFVYFKLNLQKKGGSFVLAFAPVDRRKWKRVLPNKAEEIYAGDSLRINANTGALKPLLLNMSRN